MVVAIPSKGRPTGVKSQKKIPCARVYVPAFEMEDYKRAGVQNVVAVPNDVRGITKTRNWMLQDIGDPDVVMIDDDLKRCAWIEKHHDHSTYHEMDGDSILKEWHRLFDITRGMGYRIFGPFTQGQCGTAYAYWPFRWQSVVTASCMGICNESGIRFDESFPVKEDYELCLRCILEDGGVVSAQYWYWENSHWGDEGGCKEYRTGEMENDCIERLMQMYPGIIRKVERKGTRYAIRMHF